MQLPSVSLSDAPSSGLYTDPCSYGHTVVLPPLNKWCCHHSDVTGTPCVVVVDERQVLIMNTSQSVS